MSFTAFLQSVWGISTICERHPSTTESTPPTKKPSQLRPPLVSAESRLPLVGQDSFGWILSIKEIETKRKGVYHIHLVDEVTQFEFMGAVETISESHLIPMLEQLLALLPFVIVEIHADNGSEYINQYVAKLLQKLFVKLTKSRPRHSNDNALIESKNGSVIRKWMGYAFLPKGYAKQINVFYFGSFHEYVNFHRPCVFPKVTTDAKGKQKKTYPQENYLTPFEKLHSLPHAQNFLKKAVQWSRWNRLLLVILTMRWQPLSSKKGASCSIFEQMDHGNYDTLIFLVVPFFRLILGLENTFAKLFI